MQIEYTSWDGKQKSWNPETDGHFFVVVSKYPVSVEDPATLLHLESGSISRHLGSEAEADEWLQEIVNRFPQFDWSDSDARLVKAPCAFDARENGVLVKYLTAPTEAAIKVLFAKQGTVEFVPVSRITTAIGRGVQGLESLKRVAAHQADSARRLGGFKFVHGAEWFDFGGDTGVKAILKSGIIADNQIPEFIAAAQEAA